MLVLTIYYIIIISLLYYYYVDFLQLHQISIHWTLLFFCCSDVVTINKLQVLTNYDGDSDLAWGSNKPIFAICLLSTTENEVPFISKSNIGQTPPMTFDQSIRCKGQIDSMCVFRCVLASLYEALSVRPSVRPSVGPSVRRSVRPSVGPLRLF